MNMSKPYLWIDIKSTITSLDNSLIPAEDNVYDIGSEDYRWRYIYYGTELIGRSDTADDTNTLCSAPDILFLNSYWNGSEAVDYSIKLKSEILDTSPSGVFRISLNNNDLFNLYEDRLETISIKPISDNVYSLGSDTLKWSELYVYSIYGDGNYININDSLNIASGKQIIFPNENLEYKIQFATRCGISIRSSQEVDWLLDSSLSGHYKIIKTDGSTETSLFDLDKNGNLSLSGYINSSSLYLSNEEVIDSSRNLVGLNYVSQNLVPSSDDIYYIGSSTNRWKDGYFSGSLITNTLTASGSVDVNSLLIDGTEVIDNYRIFKNIAGIACDLIPNSDETYSLGSSSYKWDTLYVRYLESSSLESNYGHRPCASLESNGDIYLKSGVATSSSTLKDSPSLIFRGAYWDSTDSLSVDYDASIYLNMISESTEPRGELTFEVGSTILFKLDSQAIRVGGDILPFNQDTPTWDIGGLADSQRFAHGYFKYVDASSYVDTYQLKVNTTLVIDENLNVSNLHIPADLIDSGNIQISLIPNTDNSLDLGSSSKRWANLYIVNVNASNLIAGDLKATNIWSNQGNKPFAKLANNGTISLYSVDADSSNTIQDSPSLNFHGSYYDGTNINDVDSHIVFHPTSESDGLLRLFVLGNIALEMNKSYIYTKNILPQATEQYVVGDGSSRFYSGAFKYLHISENIDTYELKVNTELVIDSSRILKNISKIDCNLIPNTDNVYDLGSSSYRWANLYAVNLNVSNLVTGDLKATNLWSNQGNKPYAKLANTGTISLYSVDADSSNTIQDAPPIVFHGSYYDGSNVYDVDSHIDFHPFSDSNGALRFFVLSTKLLELSKTEAECSVTFKAPSFWENGTPLADKYTQKSTNTGDVSLSENETKTIYSADQIGLYAGWIKCTGGKISLNLKINGSTSIDTLTLASGAYSNLVGIAIDGHVVTSFSIEATDESGSGSTLKKGFVRVA